MSKDTYSLNAAVHRFLNAFHAYETAAQKMHSSLQRMNRLTLDFCEPLKTIIHTTGSAVSTRRPV